MNFFNDIGRGFQDFGNIINNEVIQPAEITINKEIIKPAGNAFNPNTLKNAFDPTQNGFINWVY